MFIIRLQFQQQQKGFLPLSPIFCSFAGRPSSLTSFAAVGLCQHEVRGLRCRGAGYGGGGGAGDDGGGGADDGGALVGVRMTSLWVSRDRGTD